MTFYNETLINKPAVKFDLAFIKSDLQNTKNCHMSKAQIVLLCCLCHMQ